MRQQVLRHAAEHRCAQTLLAVDAHHQEVGVVTPGFLRQCLALVFVAGLQDLRRGIDAMFCQVSAYRSGPRWTLGQLLVLRTSVRLACLRSGSAWVAVSSLRRAIPCDDHALYRKLMQGQLPSR